LAGAVPFLMGRQNWQSLRSASRQLAGSPTVTPLGVQVLYSPQIDSKQLRANVFAFGGEDLRHKKVSIGAACSEAPKTSETKTEPKKEALKPPEPVSGKTAFYEMYKPGRTHTCSSAAGTQGTS
jgi:hypothetical protein